VLEVRMPSLGEGATEGTLLRWCKRVGESIAEGEVLAEIMTDKVNVEFECPAAGVVTALCVPEEAVVQVGAVIAMLEPPSVR
jgi:pyruvate/2-oxoglutarate dehydrogenase complex dihydrolipoamide acyltransferase (E2) component